MTETTTIRFDTIDVAAEMVAILDGLGFTRPTEVQALAIPRLLHGKDLVVQSRTGSGKTLAYGIPLVQNADPRRHRVQGLILTPTRELAVQVGTVLSTLGAPRKIRCESIYGGDSMSRQVKALEEPPQVIAATPGRLLDHIRRQNISLRDCFYAVLDEADEMLSMGFYEEVDRILKQLPRDRQMVLCSATIPQSVLSVAYNHMDEPERLSLSDDYLSVREIEHLYVHTTEMQKEETLARILAIEEPESCIVFCNTRDEARLVSNGLKNRGLSADLISGELTQAQRERVMARIKGGKLKIMVATDVAARGIDVIGLPLVVCFSTSESPEVYIHRSGRTGRVGRRGRALSLVAAKDLHAFNRTEKANGLTIAEIRIPSDMEIRDRKSETMWNKLLAHAAEHEIEEGDLYLQIVERLQEKTPEARAVAYALVRHFFMAEETPRHPPEAVANRQVKQRPKRPQEKKEGRRGSRRAESAAKSCLVLSVGARHGADQERIATLLAESGMKPGAAEIRVEAEETIVIVAAHAVFLLAENLQWERLNGHPVFPLLVEGAAPVAGD